MKQMPRVEPGMDDKPQEPVAEEPGFAHAFGCIRGAAGQ